MANTVYFDADGTEVSEYELELRFDDMLDDCYEPVVLFGRYEYIYSRAVKGLDPILYREAYCEYLDSLITDGELFESDPTLDDTE